MTICKRVFLAVGVQLASAHVGLPQESEALHALIRIEAPVLRFEESLKASLPVAGRVEDVAVEEGDRVTKGAVLLRLNVDELLARRQLVEQRAAGMEAENYARALVAMSRDALDNANTANRKLAHTLPATEVRRRQLELEAAERELALRCRERMLAELELQVLDAELQNYHFTAPFDCFVRQRLVSPGAMTLAGEPMLELINVQSLRLEGYVDIDASLALQVGQEVVIRCGDREAKGSLVFIDLAAQQVRRKIRVWASVPAASNLRAGEDIEAWMGR